MNVALAVREVAIQKGYDKMPSALQEVIEKHLEGHTGLPTPELVMAICEEEAAISHKEKVLKYFLLESPLRARNLGDLCVKSIGSNRSVQICHEIARIRERKLLSGWKPRWEAAVSS